MVRIALIAVLLTFAPTAGAQQFGPAQFAIKDEDGDPISNHALAAAQVAQVARLPGLIAVGPANADVTIYQFYDLNCPFCREASADVDKLIREDTALRLVFVPYPVLSVPSIEGARVELALHELASPVTFLEFHRKIYAGRGIIDGARALAAAGELGIDPQRIVKIANEPRITETMRTHARIGGALRLVATPSYLIAGVAILGHPGLQPLRKLVADVRACGKVVC
jgi:protein-disulfide isomerase